MYLTSQRVQNLYHNMSQWVENPHPIVIDISSDILHCKALQDILWTFTKGVYTLEKADVQHRFLAGCCEIELVIIVLYIVVSFMLSLIPLFSDKKSYFFLFFLVALVPYLFTTERTKHLVSYYFRSRLCPVFIKVWGYHTLYKSGSRFIWCNEFRKQKVVNPTYVWIDEEYANNSKNNFPHAGSGFIFEDFVQLRVKRDKSFVLTCQGWPVDDPNTPRVTQHDLELSVKFDNVNLNESKQYTNVTLSFSDKGDLLGNKMHSFVAIERLQLIEKLFHSYSDPKFGGFVEKIRRGFRSGTYLGHCSGFLDTCHKIINADKFSKPLVFKRSSGADDSRNFIIGVPLG